MLRDLLGGELAGRVATVSSFGTESALLLHMASQAERTAPVIFVDNLKVFPETLAYRDDLVARLGLSSLRVIHPRSEEHNAELQSLMHSSYAVHCLKSINN